MSTDKWSRQSAMSNAVSRHGQLESGSGLPIRAVARRIADELQMLDAGLLIREQRGGQVAFSCVGQDADDGLARVFGARREHGGRFQGGAGGGASITVPPVPTPPTTMPTLPAASRQISSAALRRAGGVQSSSSSSWWPCSEMSDTGFFRPSIFKPFFSA